MGQKVFDEATVKHIRRQTRRNVQMRQGWLSCPTVMTTCPFFASRFDIAVRLSDLFQRIASVNDRLQLSRLDAFFEENQIFSPGGCRPEYDFPAAAG